MTDTEVKGIIQRFNVCAANRSLWESQWQEVKELVLCDTADFNRLATPGQRRHDPVFDSTAIDACEEFASGLHSYLSSPTERWFELGVAIAPGQKSLDMSDDPDGLAWLEDVSDAIYQVYSDPRTKFNQSMHECYLDIGAFGTTCLSQEWDDEEMHVIFQSYALAQFYFEEDARGNVGRLYRKFRFNGDQMEEKFGQNKEYQGTKVQKSVVDAGNNAVNRQFDVIHCVMRRGSRVAGRMDAQNKRWGSYYVCVNTAELMEERGYDTIPYAVSRWVKSSEEVYGRGPGMKCLPDIKVLQRQEQVMLKAGQKAVDPPMIAPDDAFTLPIKTAPGSVNYKEPGTEDVAFMEFKGNLQFGVEQSQTKREQIRNSFHADWFKRFHKNREQSATEVTDDRDEMLRFLAPMLGRQQNELLGPTIARTYALLHFWQRIPPAPRSIQQKTLVITYISPAARAQQGVKADRIARFMADITPLQQVAPDVMDAIDTDEMVKLYASVRGVSRKVMRSPQDIAQIRQQKQQQAQMQNAAQTAEPASKSVLNLAQAAAANPGSTGGPQ